MMQRSFMANVLVLLCAVSLGACGGGDGGNGGAPTGTGNPNGGGTPVNNLNNVVGGSIQGQALNLSGQVSTWAGLIPGTDGANNNAHFSLPTGLATDGTDLYIADTADNLIRKLSLGNTNNGQVSTVAGTGSPGRNTTLSIGAAQATFNHPYAVAIAPSGTMLYVADSGNNQIRMIDLNNSTVTTIAGSPTGASGFADGVGTAATFNNPRGLAINDAGTMLYVADSENYNIREIYLTATTGTNPVPAYTVTTIAGDTGTPATAASSAIKPVSADVDSTQDPTTGTYSAGTTARFTDPEGIAYAANLLYVADGNLAAGIQHIKIRVVDLGTSGNPVATLATGFINPKGVTVGVDTTGAPTLYIADTNNNQIKSITNLPTSISAIANTVTPTLFAGNGNAGDTAGTSLATAEFDYPYSLAMVGSDLYVTDNASNIIRGINAGTGVVNNVAGFSRLADPNGIYNTAQFFHPTAVTTDGNSLYVADTDTSKIRKVDFMAPNAGHVSTLVDNSNNPPVVLPKGLQSPLAITNDGTYLYITDAGDSVYKMPISNPTISSVQSIIGVSYPTGITVLGSYLYVVENSKNDILEIDKNTMKATGTVASNLKSPQGITTDGTNLYVTESDQVNNYYAVDKIDMTQTTPVVSTLVSGDGSTTLPMLYQPSGITSDGTNLYVTTANAVLEMNIPTTQQPSVTPLAGPTNPLDLTLFGYTDGASNLALFNYPMGITTDGTALYIADSRNNNIRLLQ